MEETVIGFVAGIIWPQDGHEWLATKRGLTALDPRVKDSKPALYQTEEEALRRKEQLLEEWGDNYSPFIRPYVRASFVG